MTSTQDMPGFASPAAVACTDPGKARPNNEDRFALPPDLVPGEMRLRRGHLYLVADGMGGHHAGEVAAELAVRIIAERFYNDATESGDAPPFDVDAALRQSIAEAAEGIRFEQMLTRERAQMGTTVVAAVIRGGRLWVANVGDSRCYRLRDGNLEILSRDHAWVAEQLRAGILTPELARAHPQRSALTRALGHPVSAEPDIFTFDWRSGDRLLLCSDGLWECVPDEKIARLLRMPDAGDAAKALIGAANEAGGPDNVTVLLVGAGASAPAAALTQSAGSDPVPATVRLPPVDAVAGASAAAQGVPVRAASAPPPVRVVTPKPGVLTRLAVPVAGLVAVCLCVGLIGLTGVFAAMGGLSFLNPPPPPTAPPTPGARPSPTAPPPTVAVTPEATLAPATPAPTATPALVATAEPLGPVAGPSPTPLAGPARTPQAGGNLTNPASPITGSAALSATSTATRTQAIAGLPGVTGTLPLTPSAALTASLTVTPPAPGTLPYTSTYFAPGLSADIPAVFDGITACASLDAGTCVSSAAQFPRGTRRVYLSWDSPLPIGMEFRAEWLHNGQPRLDAGDACVVTDTGCNAFVTRTTAMLTYVTAIPPGVWTYRLYAGERLMVQGVVTIR